MRAALHALMLFLLRFFPVFEPQSLHEDYDDEQAYNAA